MSISKIQTGDKVKIIAGKNKGLVGVILKVISTRNSKRVVVDTLDKIVKYKKPNAAYGVQGQMLQVPRPIEISNVALVDNNGTISKSYVDSIKKIRLYRSTNLLVEKTIPKKNKRKVELLDTK